MQQFWKQWDMMKINWQCQYPGFQSLRQQISILIYLGRKNLHSFPHFVYGGRIECRDFQRFNYKALFWLTCLAWIRILYIAYNSMEEDNLHVTEDRSQSLVRGIVGELFVPDNRPRQDQQFGATEACRELELITGNVDAEKQCQWSCCYFLDFV
jgi:hypothetical protein